MSRFQILVALNVAFIAGCIASQLALVVPPARAGTTPQRWEQKCLSITAFGVAELPAPMSQAISRMGAAGWELTTAGSPDVFCFKRPL